MGGRGAGGQKPARTPGEAIAGPACWNEAGVYGLGSCPELQRFTHCRNCPVYSTAGVQLLNRPLPQGYRREWTERFAQEKESAEPKKTSTVLFRVNAEWLGLPTSALQEVAERRRIHSLPHRQKGIVLGLVNVRGELLISISLGHVLGLEGMASHERLRTCYGRLLVTSWDGSRFAFPVEEVHGTHWFDLEELKTPPATVTKSKASFAEGILHWRGRSVGFLDAHSLFSSLSRNLT